MDNQDDIQIDASDENLDDSVLAEEAQGDAIKKLKEKLAAAQEKAREHLDSWQRAQADFVNIRKRDEESKQEFLKFAKADMISELIPVLDSFSMALAHPTTGSGQAANIEPIYKQMMSILKGSGLEEIDPKGETFDPRLHEAIASVKTDKESEDHKVIEVLQKGYSLGGKVLRPAKVKIGQYEN